MERKDHTASVIPVKARLKQDPDSAPSRGVPHIRVSLLASVAASLVLLSIAATLRKKEILTGEVGRRPPGRKARQSPQALR
jgi:hypothetical protein